MPSLSLSPSNPSRPALSYAPPETSRPPAPSPARDHHSRLVLRRLLRRLLAPVRPPAPPRPPRHRRRHARRRLERLCARRRRRLRRLRFGIGWDGAASTRGAEEAIGQQARPGPARRRTSLSLFPSFLPAYTMRASASPTSAHPPFTPLSSTPYTSRSLHFTLPARTLTSSIASPRLASPRLATLANRSQTFLLLLHLRHTRFANNLSFPTCSLAHRLSCTDRISERREDDLYENGHFASHEPQI